MKKITIIFVFVLAAVGLGAGGIAARNWYNQQQVPEPAVANRNAVVLNEPGNASGASSSASAANSIPINTQEAVTEDQIAVNNTSKNTPTQPKPSPGFPEPKDFKVYEQYKDAQTAMYGDITQGSGKEVVAGSTLVVQYRGWLTDGKEFDESYARNQAFSFTVGAHKVILGWEQAVIGMKVGGKRRLIVPSSVGYGAQGAGSIPPNALLVFDVELLEVK